MAILLVSYLTLVALSQVLAKLFFHVISFTPQFAHGREGLLSSLGIAWNTAHHFVSGRVKMCPRELKCPNHTLTVSHSVLLLGLTRDR